MNSTAPAPFPALPPHLIPPAQCVRLQAGGAWLGELCDYLRGAANLPHSQAALALATLCARLPQSDAPLPTAVPASAYGNRVLADDAAHDRYFRVYRVPGREGVAFLRSVLMAAALFHGEMQSAYGAAEARRFAAVSGGLTALLAAIAGLPLAAVEYLAPEPGERASPVAPMWRWVLGHQIFAVLTQGIIFALQEFEQCMRAAQGEHARAALALAADLLMASATAFRFTADFPAPAYHEVVRPSMMSAEVGEGFSGLLSVDHRRLVSVLVRLRPLMAETAATLALEHQRLSMALSYVYGDHKFVCARFGGAEKPSLRCPNSSPLPGVEQLQRYQQARVELLRPHSGGGDLIVG
jgi:hypothetical protein